MEANDLVFYIGFSTDSSNISGKNEEYLMTFDKDFKVKTAQLVPYNEKALCFCRIVDPDQGTFLGNVFAGGSGSHIINTRGKVIGIIGLSFFDKQIAIEEEEQVGKMDTNEDKYLHLFDFEGEKCNIGKESNTTNNLTTTTKSKIENQSFNYNIFLPTSGKPFGMMCSLLEKENEK